MYLAVYIDEVDQWLWCIDAERMCKFCWLLLGGLTTKDDDMFVLWNHDNIGTSKVSQNRHNR